MHKVYYELWPHDRTINPPIIVESPKMLKLSELQKAELIKDFVVYIGFCFENYSLGIHSSLESASARERGCVYSFVDGCFKYEEKDAQEQMVYCTLKEYNAKPSAYSLYLGALKKMEVIPYTQTAEFLSSMGVNFTLSAVCPPDFDGCVCRECGGAKYMAEPDGLINDGMLTCYLCVERRKSFKRWPYTKEEVLQREKEALENGI